MDEIFEAVQWNNAYDNIFFAWLQIDDTAESVLIPARYGLMKMSDFGAATFKAGPYSVFVELKL